MTHLRPFGSVLIVAALALFASIPASAKTILTFGFTSGGISSVNNNLGSTTITAADTPVTITQIDAALGTPIAAFLDLSATNCPVLCGATIVTGHILQSFTGTFTITSMAGGLGVNYLSGSFSDSVFGALKGPSLVLSVGQPPDSVSFTSAVIPAIDLGLSRGMSLSFADVSPAVSDHLNSLGSFHSSISGTFSGNVGQTIPEPGSLALVGLAMLGLVGFFRFAARR